MPRQRRFDSRSRAINAVPTNPPAPVMAINALSCVVGMSEPFPTVLAIEPHAAPHERIDVPPTLACGAAPVMDDTHRRHVRRRRHAGQPQAPIVILEIEKE